MGWNARFYYCGIVCLFDFSEANFTIVFTWLFSWHKRSLVALKLLNGSWIQPWWCARNQAMLIYLFVTSLTLEGSSAHYFLLYAWFHLAITQYFRLFCRRLNVNFTEDAWTSGKCLTYLVNILAGAAEQCKRNESRGVFYQSLKIIRLRFIYLFVSLACTFKRHE